MPSSSNRRAVRWLKAEFPALIASGTISAETARALEQYYQADEKSSRNVGVVLLASIGSGLVAAGIILLVAHNWDEFSRPLRSAIAFLPLIAAQCLTAFVLIRRDGSQAWRETAAIFNVAAIGTAISLVSQTYQIHGSLPDFVLVWMLLSIPLVYLLRTTLGAVLYLIGASICLFLHERWGSSLNPAPFWLLLLLVLPYFIAVYRRDRTSRETAGLAIVLATAAAIGLGFTAGYAHAHIGTFAFAGFFTAVYLCGIEFFPRPASESLHPVALLGGIAIGVMTIVMTFEEMWRFSAVPIWPSEAGPAVAVVIELAFPVAALALAVWSFIRRSVHFSVCAAAFPLVVGAGRVVAGLCPFDNRSRCEFAAAVLLDVYALALGVELITRGLRAESTARANFGLLVIAALAVARFFDSDLSFVIRAIGFIVIGLAFIFANLVLFKKRAA